MKINDFKLDLESLTKFKLRNNQYCFEIDDLDIFHHRFSFYGHSTLIRIGIGTKLGNALYFRHAINGKLKWKINLKEI